MATNEELVVNRTMKRRLAKLSGVQTMCLEARVPCLYCRPLLQPAPVPTTSIIVFSSLYSLQTMYLPSSGCVISLYTPLAVL